MMARIIREACRTSPLLLLGAMRLSCDDSDHCVLPEGSAPDTCNVASEQVAQRKDAGWKGRISKTREAYEKTIEIKRTSQNCKVANFHVREARVIIVFIFYVREARGIVVHRVFRHICV